MHSNWSNWGNFTATQGHTVGNGIVVPHSSFEAWNFGQTIKGNSLD
jgi:hypothetical protein